MKHSVAIAALVVASFGLTALPAFAQDQTTPAAKRSDREVHRIVSRDAGGIGRGGPLRLVCSDKGAEALEVAFVRLSHRIDLTDEQTALFDTFKTKALTTQTSFADDCKAALPDTTADAKPDLLDGLKARLAIQQAELTAMNQILPDFEAFYASLTDAQKADFMPRMNREGGGDRTGRGPSADRNAPGRIHRLPAPGRY